MIHGLFLTNHTLPMGHLGLKWFLYGQQWEIHIRLGKIGQMRGKSGSSALLEPDVIAVKSTRICSERADGTGNLI